MTPGRERGVAIGAVAVGACVALLAGLGSTGTSGAGTGVPGATGGASAGAALALVVLAGAGAVLLVRKRAKQALGVVLLLVALGLVTTGLSPLRVAPVLGGLLSAVGAALVVVRAGRWPQPRSRYDAPAARRDGTPRDTWEALDRGEDPTA